MTLIRDVHVLHLTSLTYDMSHMTLIRDVAPVTLDVIEVGDVTHDIDTAMLHVLHLTSLTYDMSHITLIRDVALVTRDVIEVGDVTHDIYT